MCAKLLQLCSTLQLQGLYLARLLCLWDSSGKNPGVVAKPSSRGSSQPRDGTHVSCIGSWVTISTTWEATPWSLCMPSSFSPVQLFATRWTVDPQIPLSIGFSRQEYWYGLPFPTLHLIHSTLQNLRLIYHLNCYHTVLHTEVVLKINFIKKRNWYFKAGDSEHCLRSRKSRLVRGQILKK